LLRRTVSNFDSLFNLPAISLTLTKGFVNSESLYSSKYSNPT
jgi:hypothetical protein